MSNLSEPVRASFLRPRVNSTEAERSSSLALKQNQLKHLQAAQVCYSLLVSPCIRRLPSTHR
jgi:hypothetical protein